MPASLQELESRYPERQLPPEAEIVRVAPSPTGKPHIGTAFQGVVNYALARRTGGSFILRVEDTDRKRFVPGSLEEIIDAIRWLGVPYDEGPFQGGEYGPYLQSERLPIYRRAAEWLVEQGRAYPCYCSAERLAGLREQQEARGETTRYDGRCRRLSPEERQREEAAGVVPVIRLAMPEEGEITFVDELRGEITFSAQEQDDAVLLKSDGYPTYHLAATVDDHLMRVTTVVRGEEWISSAPKHTVLYQSFGWKVPRFVHTPLLRDVNRKKLGKRSGDTSINWFRAQGYLPEAFRNWITRIIWTHPEDKDVYSYEEFISLFRAQDLSKSGPVADFALLDFISGQHIRTLGVPSLYERTEEWLRWLTGYAGPEFAFETVEKNDRVRTTVTGDALAAFLAAFTADRAYSERVLEFMLDRFKKLSDIVLKTPLFYADLHTAPTPELLRAQLKGNPELGTTLVQDQLENLDLTLTEEAWQARGYDLATRLGIKPGILFMLLRVAVTGSDRSPPLYPVLQVLGEAETRRRLQASLAALGG